MLDAAFKIRDYSDPEEARYSMTLREDAGAEFDRLFAGGGKTVAHEERQITVWANRDCVEAALTEAKRCHDAGERVRIVLLPEPYIYPADAARAGVDVKALLAEAVDYATL
jgi:hypothetical protein